LLPMQWSASSQWTSQDIGNTIRHPDLAVDCGLTRESWYDSKVATTACITTPG
jgi:hypothetical protein